MRAALQRFGFGRCSKIGRAPFAAFQNIEPGLGKGVAIAGKRMWKGGHTDFLACVLKMGGDAGEGKKRVNLYDADAPGWAEDSPCFAQRSVERRHVLQGKAEVDEIHGSRGRREGCGQVVLEDIGARARRAGAGF